MKEFVKEELQSLIIKTIAAQPSLLKKNQSYSIKYYMDDLVRNFFNIDTNIVREAIKVFIDEEYYKTKPFAYLKAIVSNKEKERQIEIEKNKRRFGSIPQNVKQ